MPAPSAAGRASPPLPPRPGGRQASVAVSPVARDAATWHVRAGRRRRQAGVSTGSQLGALVRVDLHEGGRSPSDGARVPRSLLARLTVQSAVLVEEKGDRWAEFSPQKSVHRNAQKVPAFDPSVALLARCIVTAARAPREAPRASSFASDSRSDRATPNALTDGGRAGDIGSRGSQRPKSNSSVASERGGEFADEGMGGYASVSRRVAAARRLRPEHGVRREERRYGGQLSAPVQCSTIQTSNAQYYLQ